MFAGPLFIHICQLLSIMNLPNFMQLLRIASANSPDVINICLFKSIENFFLRIKDHNTGFDLLFFYQAVGDFCKNLGWSYTYGDLNSCPLFNSFKHLLSNTL